MPYGCGICGFVADTMEEVAEHFAEVHGTMPVPSKPLFVCPVCGEAFYYKINRDYHIETQHPEYKAPKIASALIIVAVIFFLLVVAFAFKRK